MTISGCCEAVVACQCCQAWSGHQHGGTRMLDPSIWDSSLLAREGIQSSSLQKQAWLLLTCRLVSAERSPPLPPLTCGVEPFLTSSLLTGLQTPAVPHSSVCNFCQLLRLLPVTHSHFVGRVQYLPRVPFTSLNLRASPNECLGVCPQAKHCLLGLCNHPLKDYLLHGCEMVYVAGGTFWENRRLGFISPPLEN